MGSEMLSGEERLAHELNEVLDSLHVPKDLRANLLLIASTHLNQPSSTHLFLERDAG